MTIYSAYEPPSRPGTRAPDEVRLVSDAKAPLALLFPPVWLIWHRLWPELMVYVLFSAAVILLSIWQPVTPVLYLTALPGIYLLLEGNECIRRKLERSGWRFFGVVDAANDEEAEIKYLMQYEAVSLPAAREVPASGSRKTSRPALPHTAPAGLFPE